MRVTKVEQTGETATVEIEGFGTTYSSEVKLVEGQRGKHFFIAVGGTVGKGSKLWHGVQFFRLTDTGWKVSNILGGQSGRSFQPVQFWSLIPEHLRACTSKNRG